MILHVFQNLGLGLLAFALAGVGGIIFALVIEVGGQLLSKISSPLHRFEKAWDMFKTAIIWYFAILFIYGLGTLIRIQLFGGK